MALPPKAGPGLPFGGTLPDPLPVAAWVAVDWIEGENVRSTWRTALGYLVLTNLRCFGISRARELFPPRPWHVGPVFFFYNFRPPEVLYGRFVELAEERDDSREVGRFAVRDPASVAAEISSAMESGRAAWNRRREETTRWMEARQRARLAAAAGSAGMIRCSYCGNLVSAVLRRCPSCGAGLG